MKADETDDMDDFKIEKPVLTLLVGYPGSTGDPEVTPTSIMLVTPEGTKIEHVQPWMLQVAMHAELMAKTMRKRLQKALLRETIARDNEARIAAAKMRGSMLFHMPAVPGGTKGD